MNRITARTLIVVLTLVLASCATSRDAEDENGSDEERPEYVVESVGPELASAVDVVRTIQLYPTRPIRTDIPVEANLPVVALDSDQTLSLHFDLMEERGRPLAVHFYHANRTWERDLSSAEFLGGFRRDEILDYQPSHDTQTRYTHYSYTFPNESVDFLISGNYIVRVTEQESEEAVLFERAFFVSEQDAELDVFLDDQMRPGQSFAFLLPTARFRPPSGLEGNVFDFSVCFAQNGRFDEARCSDRPRLAEQPDIIFDLDGRDSFAPQVADFRMDLNDLRTGIHIEQADMSTSPYSVQLKPDYARFPDPGLDAPLFRQPVTSRVRGVSDVHTSAEYVRVQFRYVPTDEVARYGEIFVAGSFNQWRVQEDNRLTWNASDGYYEGEALVKQGEHEYTYVTRNGQRLPELEGNVPLREGDISAFVYYFDMNLSTDRLLAVGSHRTRF